MIRFALIALALLPLACGGKEEPVADTKPEINAEIGKFTLKAEPAGATSVIEAKDAEPTDEIVVEGRIDNFVRGFATFNLVDTDLDYCGSGSSQDDCKTPWDYCCTPQDEKVESTLTVEAMDGKGDLIRTDAIPDLRLLDLVVVKGKLKKDKHGNVSIQATGWYRRERPDLPKDLRWPK